MEIIEIGSSLLALIILEIVLGVDNLVFLTILTVKLPREKRKKARRWGLTFAWVTRLLLLAGAVWMVKLTRPILTISELNLSIRDMFLLIGGMFLIVKATQEIHREVVHLEHHDEHSNVHTVSFIGVIIQVALMDVIFSLDSVLTAVGLSSIFWVMALAITIAIFVMIYASEPVSQFIENFPTVKMLALTFLILIGTVLVADSFSFHIPRGYVYFAMAFSLVVEGLNLIRHRKNVKK